MRDNEQRNENRENIENVLAEMERESIIHVYIPATDLERYVKRIKEALKREKAEIEANALAVGGIVEAARRREATAEKSSAVGNAAAMREALVKVKKAICHHAEYVCQSLSWKNSDIQSNCADILCAHRDLCEAKTAINAALSAPARNCDLYDDAEIAWRAWLDDKDNWDEFGSPGLELYEWLFAPAAERKGEGDGR